MYDRAPGDDGSMTAVGRHSLARAIHDDGGGESHRQRYRGAIALRVPVLLAALLLAVVFTTGTAGPASAGSTPVLTITLYDLNMVVVGGDNYRSNADVHLAAHLVYDKGRSFSGGGRLRTDRNGHFLVGFILPEELGLNGKITVTATSAGTDPLTASLDLTAAGGGLPSPSSAPPSAGPTGSTAPSTPTGRGGNANGSKASCPNAGSAQGAPSGNAFGSGTYDGHGATLNGTFTVGAGACIQNFTINGKLELAGGASNITIVNNTISGGSNPLIDNLTNGGSNNTINFNSFGGPGTGWATLFGGGGGNTSLTIDHNHFSGGGSDMIQENCSLVCNGQEIAYNKFENLQGFAVELLYLWHTARFSYNYLTYGDNLVNHGCDGCNNQASISPFNKVLGDSSDTQYTNDGTTNFEVGYNISIGNKARGDSGGGGYPACFEARGSGLTYTHNYCLHYGSLCDFANNNNPVTNGAAWQTNNNVIIGRSGSTKCMQEGSGPHYEMNGYGTVPQNGTGNGGPGDQFYPESGGYPGVPAWNYAFGVQAN
jgi:hypothetical protein